MKQTSQKYPQEKHEFKMKTMTSNEYLEKARKKANRVEILAEELKRLIRDNEHDNQRLERLTQRKKTLEENLERMSDMAKHSSLAENNKKLLAYIENPMDFDVIGAEKYQSKMSELRILINEIIVFTSLNERAMVTEMGHQEAEFCARLCDAIKARKLLATASLEAQQTVEDLMKRRADLWEAVSQLESQVEFYESETWLCKTENRRLSDAINKKTREPKVFDCEQKHLAEKRKEPPHQPKDFEQILKPAKTQTGSQKSSTSRSRTSSSLLSLLDNKSSIPHSSLLSYSEQCSTSCQTEVLSMDSLKKVAARSTCPMHGNKASSQPSTVPFDLMAIVRKALGEEFQASL
ncbi:unnamed protein product [Caenorhabditis auriculariae]|uniref:Uncharacterized protein n=1 Tax=Caenorhabditis auriculariae TaxID=2777116 RepID=A0A8S1GWI1_9PELO|nr:unnamed protein product [Caenorhabditis auriculariae]